MKNLSSSSTAAQQTTSVDKICLQQLVSKLTTSLLPLSVQRRNLVINDIPRDLEVTGDENMLAFVLWNMISTAVTSSRNECIRVESITAGDRITIRLKGLGNYYYHTLSGQYREVQYLAGLLGGSVSLSNDIAHGQQISFNIASNVAA